MDDLATKLSIARQKSRQALAGIELSTIANRAGTWRVQDVLAHIASWEREVTASIRAAREGREHTLPVPLDLDEQNERFRAAHAGLAPAAALTMWEDTRRDFADAVETAGQAFSFTCPWGKVEPIDRVVADMIEHEETHMTKIQWETGEETGEETGDVYCNRHERHVDKHKSLTTRALRTLAHQKTSCSNG